MQCKERDVKGMRGKAMHGKAKDGKEREGKGRIVQHSGIASIGD
jgi:hypothetical protein